MKNQIAIFSDIHGNLQALQAILNDIKERGIEEIYCLGDVSAIGPNPKECLDLIIENNINLVLGNHDLYIIKGTIIDDEMEEEEKQLQAWVHEQLKNKKYKNYLDNCNLKLIKNLENCTIAFQHFLFNENKDDLYPFEDLKIVKDGSINLKLNNFEEDLIFVGHEHNAFEIIKDNKNLICVGSSGCRKDDKTFYTILTVCNDAFKIEKINIKYDRKDFLNNFNKSDYPFKDIIGRIFFGIVKGENNE